MEVALMLILAILGPIAWLSINQADAFYRAFKLLFFVTAAISLVLFGIFAGFLIAEHMPEMVGPIGRATIWAMAIISVLLYGTIAIHAINQPKR